MRVGSSPLLPLLSLFERYERSNTTSFFFSFARALNSLPFELSSPSRDRFHSWLPRADGVGWTLRVVFANDVLRRRRTKKGRWISVVERPSPGLGFPSCYLGLDVRHHGGLWTEGFVLQPVPSSRFFPDANAEVAGTFSLPMICEELGPASMKRKSSTTSPRRRQNQPVTGGSGFALGCREKIVGGRLY